MTKEKAQSSKLKIADERRSVAVADIHCRDPDLASAILAR
jgi:hypothetical protein